MLRLIIERDLARRTRRIRRNDHAREIRESEKEKEILSHCMLFKKKILARRYLYYLLPREYPFELLLMFSFLPLEFRINSIFANYTASRKKSVVLFLSATMEKEQKAEQPIEENFGISLVSVVPRHYAIRIFPDSKSNTTHGTTDISIEVKEPKGISRLELNACLLSISSVSYENGGLILTTPLIHCTEEILSVDFSPAVLPVRRLESIFAQFFFDDSFKIHYSKALVSCISNTRESFAHLEKQR